MNKGEIRYSAVLRAGYDPGRDLPVETLDPFFDEAVHMVVSLEKWPFLLKTVSVPVTANQQEYVLTTDWTITDFQSPHSLIQAGKRFGKLKQIPFEAYLQMFGDDPTINQTFDYWYFKGNDTVGIVPKPAATQANALKFSYFKRPTLMSADTDQPQWDASFHHILVDYIAARICENLEDFERAQFLHQRFLSMVAEMRDFYERQAEAENIIYGLGTNMNTQSGRYMATLNLPFD